MSRTFIIYFSWRNTADNHAGMTYLLKNLKHSYPGNVKLIKTPSGINNWPLFIQKLYFHSLVFCLEKRLKPADKLLFMEYFGIAAGNQLGMALKLRKKGIESRFYGMVHLSVNLLSKLYDNDNDLRIGLESIDKVIVLGSSLTGFFDSLGFRRKILQTFHYVDSNYYKPSDLPKSEKLQVIHMGNLERNFKALKNIVIECPEVNFHICQGLFDLSSKFGNLPNATLYGFLKERDLLKLMQKCHISLSVMDDTVGSNVITTSMACGLVNVVSDVGSIRDYCNVENSVLCKSVQDFVDALKNLKSDKSFLTRLSQNSLNCSSELTLDKSVSFFYSNILADDN